MPAFLLIIIALIAAIILFAVIAVAFDDGGVAWRHLLSGLFFLGITVGCIGWFSYAECQPWRILYKQSFPVETVTFPDGSKQQFYRNGGYVLISGWTQRFLPEGSTVVIENRSPWYSGVYFAGSDETRMEFVCPPATK